MSLDPVDITHFATPEEFREWMEANHDRAEALWVGFWKRGTGRPSLTWPESVDVALCFGWIDGIRKRIDDEAYTIRFTPRREGSVWSKRNVERYGAMESEGLVHPAGAAAWARRTEAKTGLYSYEKERPSPDWPQEWAARIEAEGLGEVWASRPPGWRRTHVHWVTSAKRDATREKRFGEVVEELRRRAQS